MKYRWFLGHETPFPQKKYIEIIEIKEEIEHKIESMRGNKSNTINGKIYKLFVISWFIFWLKCIHRGWTTNVKLNALNDFSRSLLRWENIQIICYLLIYLLMLFVYLLLSCFFIIENRKYTYYFNFSITNCHFIMVQSPFVSLKIQIEMHL